MTIIFTEADYEMCNSYLQACTYVKKTREVLMVDESPVKYVEE